jgi:Asp-tRNA(Asn)/Glu-tRNA(Gln) amidotransferase A subunit family amidase
MMGRCPAISVPSGIGDNGVPTGLQIVSTAYDDASVFMVAGALERARAAAGCRVFPEFDG